MHYIWPHSNFITAIVNSHYEMVDVNFFLFKVISGGAQGLLCMLNSGSLLEGLRRPCGMLGLKPRTVTCKASDLFTKTGTLAPSVRKLNPVIPLSIELRK